MTNCLIHTKTPKTKQEKTTSTVQRMEDEMTKLKAEVERLAEFSRRELYRALADVLNSVAGPKRWTTDDTARVHRARKIRVNFNRWKDKMAVLSSRQFRDNFGNRETT